MNSVDSFNSAQASAVAGDVIIWKNGTYSDVDLSIDKDGITFEAETIGMVIFNGTSICSITGNSVTFSGFQYIGGDIVAASLDVLWVYGNYDKILQCNFSGIIANKYITVAGGTQYNLISYCNFENKPVGAPPGCIVQISTSATVPGYHKITHCTFQNFPGSGGDNGNEPIRIGLGVEAANNSRTVVEYCYFNNTGPGDSETLSLKCCENVIRFCTFDNNPLGMLVFRNGDRNVAYGNFFINGSGGIRCKEANNIYCYNNYFETSGASGDMQAIRFDYVSPNPYNINFAFNTFVNCGDIDLGGVGPTAINFTNNIFSKSSGDIFTDPNGQTSFSGNIYQGTLGITIDSGMNHVNPRLVRNSDGYYGLSSGSPAINAAKNFPTIIDIDSVDDDPLIMYDISGQTRPAGISLKDVGCDEYAATGVIINRPLKLSDGGPTYLQSTDIKQDNVKPDFFGLFQNYPNPFNPETNIKYAVPVSCMVKLKIFDSIGKEVGSLVDQFQKQGTYTVSLNAADFRLSSGVYFYRISTGSNTKCMKMIYLK